MTTLEGRVLDALNQHEGTEAFNLPCGFRQASAALQRLKRKGLVEAVRCPDGAWVWLRLSPHPDDCSMAGHEWFEAGGGLLICGNCHAEKWSEDV